jgi:thiamine-phosphate pyrophosphorylase
MDQRLLRWGRAVKRRRRNNLPTLWYFTDFARAPDPLPVIAQLPRGICGVVFRHDRAPNRASLASTVAKLCKYRGIPLVIAGDTRLAARMMAGAHLRGGRWPDCLRRRGLVTSSAHGAMELRRARLAGAEIVFISPVFPTASHAGASGMGAVRWNRLASSGAYALGGISGGNIARLTRARGAGAISAFTP